MKKAHHGELIIVDATHSRTKAITAYKKFSDMGYRVVGIDFSKDIDIETILEQNRNRDPIKFVPEHVIESMHERCQSLEIPNWVQVIKPEEFIEHYTNVIMDFSNFDKITFIGDIHGCKNELNELLHKSGIDFSKENKDHAVVFIGDYFDRGYAIPGTFNVLNYVKNTHWTLFLEGNHESSLKYYKEFIIELTLYLQQEIKKDIFDLIDEEGGLNPFQQLEEWQKQKNKILKELIVRKSKGDFTPGVYDFFSLHRYSETTDALQKMADELQEKIDSIPNLIEVDYTILENFLRKSHKQFDSFINEIFADGSHDGFQYIVDKVLSFKIPNSLKKDENGFDKIKKSSIWTLKRFAISSFKYTEIAEFVKRNAQMFYGDFHGRKILATHGGLVREPDKRTRTVDMIKGIGSYDDAELCMKTFSELHPDIYQVHGHRNMTLLPIQVTDTTFNINGDVDLGLRSVTFHKDGTIEKHSVKPHKETIDFFRKAQIEKAKKFNAKKLAVHEEGEGLIRMFQDHKHIDVKKLTDNIAAINFTKKAFETGIWDEYTIKARGLFVDIDKNNSKNFTVIARGYQKFFNVGERHGFNEKDIRDLVYPLYAFEKSNGYLGLISVDNRDPNNPKWFISSKSSIEGDFALKFREMVAPKLNTKLLTTLINDNATMVFEVIEPQWDPHIETYTEPELVLLDVIKNDINFEKKPYEELEGYIDLFKKTPIKIRPKKLIKICKNFNEYWNLVKDANRHPILSDDGIEGFVFEDSSSLTPHMFKVKVRWYTFWKYVRSIKSRISSRLRNLQKRKNFSGELKLDKSDRITIKQQLHSVEEFQLFEFMVDLAEKDLDAFEEMSIIEVRQKFLKEKNVK
jgi:hypothetical protein